MTLFQNGIEVARQAGADARVAEFDNLSNSIRKSKTEKTMDTFSLLFSAPSPKVEKTIEVNLEDLEQFFNTMDPSPFHEKDWTTTWRNSSLAGPPNIHCTIRSCWSCICKIVLRARTRRV